jgi:hypothetical protein
LLVVLDRNQPVALMLHINDQLVYARQQQFWTYVCLFQSCFKHTFTSEPSSIEDVGVLRYQTRLHRRL